MINYKHLYYFWAVAREGGVARASERLNLTSQTISGQLSLLEEYLGVDLLSRVGRNLELTDTGRMVLSYADEIFALGGELEVPPLNGRVNLKIPPETQTGKMFRMRGKGVKPVRGGPQGDLICRVLVETPVKLTEHQRSLLLQLDESLKGGGSKHSPNAHSWVDSVKGFFEKMGL